MQIIKEKEQEDTKSLLGDYITAEELWACTSCNACTDACPIELDPLSIIMDMSKIFGYGTIGSTYRT